MEPFGLSPFGGHHSQVVCMTSLAMGFSVGLCSWSRTHFQKAPLNNTVLIKMLVFLFILNVYH